MMGNSMRTPIFSWMLRTQAMCENTLSMDRPSRSQFSLRSSG